MKRMLGAVVSLFTMVFLANPAWAGQTNRYVVQVNPGAAPPYTNWTIAATNIMDAVAWANTNNAGDIVWVSNGTYVLNARINVTNTQVRGWSGNAADVIVDGGVTNQCFYLAHANAFVSAMTISNGVRGLYLNPGTVSNCVIANNPSTSDGAGVYCSGASLVANCVISNNRANQYGGGVFLNASGEVRDSFLTRNYCLGGNKGGAAIWMAGACAVRRCRIYENGDGTYHTGTMTISGENGILESCAIWNNTAWGVLLWPGSGNGAQIRSCTIVSNFIQGSYGGGFFQYDTTCTGWVMQNCILYGNSGTAAIGDTFPAAVSYTNNFWNCLSYRYRAGYPLSASQGNFPEFTDPKFVNWATKDLHLLVNSPCINTGTNAAWMWSARDLDGRNRIDIFSRQADMGAYEFLRVGSMVTFR